MRKSKLCPGLHTDEIVYCALNVSFRARNLGDKQIKGTVGKRNLALDPRAQHLRSVETYPLVASSVTNIEGWGERDVGGCAKIKLK